MNSSDERWFLLCVIVFVTIMFGGLIAEIYFKNNLEKTKIENGCKNDE